MKRKGLIITLVLVILVVMLVPATVAARGWRTVPKPNTITVTLVPEVMDDTVIGTEWPIRDTAETNVWAIIDMDTSSEEPAATIVGWVVNGRSIYGEVEGGIDGNFSFTYSALVDDLQTGTMQGITVISNDNGQVYLSEDGTIDSEITCYFTFEEINAWCEAIGIPTAYFCAEVYEYPDLAGLPVEILAAMYGSELPLLPKCLDTSFSGTASVDAGTGQFADIEGKGVFNPKDGVPMSVYLYPNQHVASIEGEIELTCVYTNTAKKRVLDFDRDEVRDRVTDIWGNYGDFDWDNYGDFNWGDWGDYGDFDWDYNDFDWGDYDFNYGNFDWNDISWGRGSFRR